MLGELILGFFIFAGLIMGMGGGDFFMKLATALMGRVRGGQAKIAVLASGFFGSITGSPIANIAGTGSFTIPAMKKAGYSPEYAAAIEACASTGSDTMPPVLGGLAFIMIVISGADYGSVVIAAFLPSLLFYLGLLVQVDAYAARNRMKALPREEIPPLWPVLREGWVYLVGIAALLVGLVYLRWGAITPVYATAIIIVLQLLSWLARRALPSDMPRPTLRQTLEAAWGRTRKGLVQAAGLINYTVAIFIGMGFILVGVLKTGMAGGLTNWIVGAGGSSIYLILGVCFAFSLFMGMFGLQRTGYLFLALIAVPAIVTLSRTMPEFAATGGLPAMGLNLFLIFYAGLGGLTPPVALNSFIAANISGANPMKTAWLSLRLGAVLLFLPFFFVLQPSLLILYTPWWQTLLHFAQAAAGIWLLSSGLEGYLIGAGELRRPERALLVAGGVLVAFPQVAALAAGCTIVAAAAALILTRKRPAASPAEKTLDNKTEAIR
jgi:TRAP transporter 4TM/12TM fusion protein